MLPSKSLPVYNRPSRRRYTKSWREPGSRDCFRMCRGGGLSGGARVGPRPIAGHARCRLRGLSAVERRAGQAASRGHAPAGPGWHVVRCRPGSRVPRAADSAGRFAKFRRGVRHVHFPQDRGSHGVRKAAAGAANARPRTAAHLFHQRPAAPGDEHPESVSAPDLRRTAGAAHRSQAESVRAREFYPVAHTEAAGHAAAV